MLLYDDQRMCVCTGLPRIMEQLGLLHSMTGKGNMVAKGRIVTLGHGRPTKQYRLAYDKSRLEDLLQKTSSVQVPEHLSNDTLLAHYKAISSMFDQWPALRSTSSAGNSHMVAIQRRTKLAKKQNVDSKQQIKLGYLGAKKQHQGKMSKETHGSSVPASGILKRKGKPMHSSYTCKHFMRKHLVWLVNHRSLAGQTEVDFDKMLLDDFRKLVPDQLDNISAFSEVKSAGELGRMLQQPPMMTSCILCLLVPVVKMTQKTNCALESSEHHPALIAILEKHQKEYGIPPSPSWLLAEFARGLPLATRKAPKRTLSIADTDSLGVGTLRALPIAVDTVASDSLPASGFANAGQAPQAE